MKYFVVNVDIFIILYKMLPLYESAKIEAEAEETARKNKREMEQAISLALMKSTSVEDSPVFM